MLRARGLCPVRERHGLPTLVGKGGGDAIEHMVEPVPEARLRLQDGTVTKDYIAREVFGEEKAIWWERAVAAYPPYADYQSKTTRQIPVFVLPPS